MAEGKLLHRISILSEADFYLISPRKGQSKKKVPYTDLDPNFLAKLTSGLLGLADRGSSVWEIMRSGDQCMKTACLWTGGKKILFLTH